MLPDATVSVGCGTSILNELVPNVVVTAAPDETTEAFRAAGNVTVLPPLMLRLPELMLKVGWGTSMLNELGARVVTTAAPEAVTLVKGVATTVVAITTVLPPLMLSEFPDIASEGVDDTV
jgi:hypothetical protein